MQVTHTKETQIEQQTIEFISNPRLFDYELNALKLRCHFLIYERLSKWQKFFNDTYMSAPCIYSQLNFALIQLASNSYIFQNQTAYEFGLSKAFFRRLISSGVFLKLYNIECAKFLLNISLIFSLYPGMVIRPFQKAFEVLKDGITEDKLILMFQKLFVKYESPHLLIRHLNLLSFNEVKALVHILSGQNLRSFQNLPYPVSKKESFLFHNKLPESLNFKNNILKRALIYSKLLMVKHAQPERLVTFLNSSKVFENAVDDYYKEIDFWKQAFSLVSQIGLQTIYISLQDYVDYFEYQKYTLNPNYSLKGRTVTSIVRAIGGIHETIKLAQNKRLKCLSWPRVTEVDIAIKAMNTEYLFKELTSGEQLFEESSKLKHCVFTYTEYCVSGSRSIWSMTKKTDQGYIPCLTIEVRNKEIIQIAGRNNRSMNEDEEIIIDQWSAQIGFINTCFSI